VSRERSSYLYILARRREPFSPSQYRVRACVNEGTARASSGEWSESSSRAARGALTHTRVWRERVQLRERTKSELGSVYSEKEREREKEIYIMD